MVRNYKIAQNCLIYMSDYVKMATDLRAGCAMLHRAYEAH